MCGRYYYADRTPKEVEAELEITIDESFMKAGDITPAMKALALAANKGGSGSDLRIARMLWGLMGKDNKLIINARAESALEKPMFSDSIKQRRLIIPAAGFYEWDKDRNKVTFFRKDKSPIYIAGFYQLSQNEDSFVILTTTANESMEKVHDRMPLMIDKKDVKDWLYDSEAAKEMLSMEMPMLESHQEYEQLSFLSWN